jgi:hypothetical protein
MNMDRTKFYRRRQFVLAPRHIAYEGWKRLQYDSCFFLTVHPDLPVISAEAAGNKALLLGYLIDPDFPDQDENTILQRFVQDRLSCGGVVDKIMPLIGRFVLIIRNGGSLLLFHDPSSLRQVNYCRDGHGAIWCASQPEVLAEELGYEHDPDALEFRNLPEFRRTLEDFALIGDRTPYKPVKYLLANHYLDLTNGTVHRYWPYPGCIGRLSIKESIKKYCSILENSIKAAARKFDLKMGISAGCDSRKSLAASKAVRDRITYFTQTPMADHAVDMEVPARLLPKLGLKHHKVELREMSEEFQSLYERSATWARERTGHIAFSCLKKFGPEATILNSNISEYSQVSYWLPKRRINGEGLAILKGLNISQAISDFQKWLDEAIPICKASRMNVLVLFQLELRSRWVANSFAECDISYESFNPYASRRIFSTELSVNERWRRGRRIDIPIRQIKHMWPEVLSEPINPRQDIAGRFMQLIVRRVIHKVISPLSSILEYLRYQRLKERFNRDKEMHGE